MEGEAFLCVETVECILELAGPPSPAQAVRDLQEGNEPAYVRLALLTHVAHVLLGKELERRRVITTRAMFGKQASPGAR